MHSFSAPWTAVLSGSQYQLIHFVLVAAGLALFAAFVRAVVTRHEVGTRYRSATVARLAITGVALVSYLLIVANFSAGYELIDGSWHPNELAILPFSLRYSDWLITVPLLAAELLTVCVIAGGTARSTLMVAMTGAGLMIFTGFLGAIIGADSRAALALWGGISTVCWIVTTIVLVRAVRASFTGLTPEAAALLARATRVLLIGWALYPMITAVQFLDAGAAGATTILIALSVADVVVKLGFGTLIHRVAKLRTAEDVRAGVDIHPESIWISSIKQSDAGLPRETYLAQDAAVHAERPKQPIGRAVPTPAETLPSDPQI